MSGYTFRATWPVEQGTDVSAVGIRRLIVQASAEVDGLAAEAGCRIAGQIEWRWQLVASASAWPIEEVAA